MIQEHRVIEGMLREGTGRLSPTQLWAIMHTFLDPSWNRHEQEVQWEVPLPNGKLVKSSSTLRMVERDVAENRKIIVTSTAAIDIVGPEVPLHTVLSAVVEKFHKSGIEIPPMIDILIPMAWKSGRNHFTLLVGRVSPAHKTALRDGKSEDMRATIPATLNVMHFDPQYKLLSTASQKWAGESYGPTLQRVLTEWAGQRGITTGWMDEPLTEYAQVHGLTDMFHRLRSIHCGRYVVIAILSYLSANPDALFTSTLNQVLGPWYSF